MQPLEAIHPAGFAVPAVVGLLVAVGWVAGALWVERDAHAVFGRSRPWKTRILALGPLLLAGACLAGRSFVPAAAALVAVCMAAYVVARDLAAPPDRRLVQVPWLIDGIARVVRTIGLDRWLEQLRGSGPALAVAADRSVILLKKDGSEYSGSEGGTDREIAAAIRTTQRILGEGIAARATDIHFEPKSSQECQLRYRVDGMLRTHRTLSGAEGRAVVSALKVLADMDIAERRRPQDGTFAVLAAERRFDVRAASGPTNFGEKMALRLLDADGGLVKRGLKGLGMRDSMATALHGIIQRSHGMLVVTGPTGSGKTTSVYASLAEIDVLTRNVVTIEDPVEYRLENISQTAVNNAADLTFAKILRSVLRQDPDVILVGEIRDRETAEIAMQAALTGHFVFTTLHANDTATTVTRLLDIGIDATLIQSAVSAVLAQRLIRLLCPECKQAYRPPAELLRRHGIPAGRVEVLYAESDRGCSHCLGSGYRGRTGVYELLVFDTAIRSLLVGRPSLEDIRNAARKAGMRTLWQSGLYKVIAGETSLAEVERVVR
jgi:type II secretory ATPase GspE/PulE/Tfp pilus assembly ATPase PilB-like protein